MIRMAMIVTLVAAAAGTASAQTSDTSWKGENLQVYPKDIGRAQLTQRMRELSFALGVRCQYCHAGGNGVSFDWVSFASDENLRSARHV